MLLILLIKNLQKKTNYLASLLQLSAIKNSFQRSFFSSIHSPSKYLHQLG